MGSVLRPDGGRIRALRITRGWPQEQLAHVAGVDARAIRKVEIGGDASFETLRSIAGAFGLHVHELMRESENTAVQSGPLRIRLAATCAPVLSLCLPYAPAFKGLVGSFALVLLVASTICLSPLLLKHNSKMPAGELSPNIALPPASILAGIGFHHDVKMQSDAASAGSKARRVVRITKSIQDDVPAPPAAAQTVSIASNPTIPHDSASAKGTHQAAEIKTEKPALAGGIDIGWLASLAEPETAQAGIPTSHHLPQATAAADVNMSVPRVEPGSVEAGAKGAQGGLGLVIEPFRRTGKGTAVLLAKVGSSLKRIF